MTNPLHQLAAAFAGAAQDIEPAAAHQVRADAARVEAEAAAHSDLPGTGTTLTFGDTSATIRTIQPAAQRNADGTAGLGVDAQAAGRALAGEMAQVGKHVLMKRLSQ